LSKEEIVKITEGNGFEIGFHKGAEECGFHRVAEKDHSDNNTSKNISLPYLWVTHLI